MAGRGIGSVQPFRKDRNELDVPGVQGIGQQGLSSHWLDPLVGSGGNQHLHYVRMTEMGRHRKSGHVI